MGRTGGFGGSKWQIDSRVGAFFLFKWGFEVIGSGDRFLGLVVAWVIVGGALEQRVFCAEGQIVLEEGDGRGVFTTPKVALVQSKCSRVKSGGLCLCGWIWKIERNLEDVLLVVYSYKRIYNIE